MHKLLQTTLPAVCFFLALATSALAWETGDIIFQESQTSQSRVIQKVTKSRYSHMGMIVVKGSKTYVLEAIQPVTLTPLDRFVARGADGHYVVKRLRPEFKPTQVQKAEMTRLANSWLGRDYDLVFGWSDTRMYCSELVWKLYKRGAGIRIGEPVTFRDLDLKDRATRILINQRTDSLDLSERIITPVAMFRSDKLVTVAQYPKPRR